VERLTAEFNGKAPFEIGILIGRTVSNGPG